MTHLTDTWVIPWLAFFAGWSLRWGVLLAALALWLAVRPPRRAATRHVLCLAALLTGILLPAAPEWGEVAIPWPSQPIQGGNVIDAEVSLPQAGPRDLTARPAFATAAADAAVPVPLPATPTVGPRRISPVAEPLGMWRVAALAAALAWATIVLALFLRLAGGRLMLAVLKARAVALGNDSARLLDDCRKALRLSRPVRLATHPSVASPVVVGGLCPMVLVPPDWGDWPEPSRHDCLLHELAQSGPIR